MKSLLLKKEAYLHSNCQSNRHNEHKSIYMRILSHTNDIQTMNRKTFNITDVSNYKKEMLNTPNSKTKNKTNHSQKTNIISFKIKSKQMQDIPINSKSNEKTHENIQINDDIYINTR